MEIKQAKKIMGENFIGPEELSAVSFKMGIADLTKMFVPKIKFNEQQLKKLSKNYILILGAPKMQSGRWLTLNEMRSHFSWNPDKSEPCFYNQDWYLKEKFAAKTHLKLEWYVLSKKVAPQTRGKDPNALKSRLAKNEELPSAVLTAYAFFAYYFLNKGEMLWKHDFIWCNDRDNNGDQIYTGRYLDPKKINRNGFNIHRHLSIKQCYGLAAEILP